MYFKSTMTLKCCHMIRKSINRFSWDSIIIMIPFHRTDTTTFSSFDSFVWKPAPTDTTRRTDCFSSAASFTKHRLLESCRHFQKPNDELIIQEKKLQYLSDWSKQPLVAALRFCTKELNRWCWWHHDDSSVFPVMWLAG